MAEGCPSALVPLAVEEQAMGPILIFDKSALELLSVDESVWLDTFFWCNITPLFYVEVLADLAKPAKRGRVARTPTMIVAEIAVKTPSTGSYPNAPHHELVLADLAGAEIEM